MRLTKMRKLLARRGRRVPYPTLHRFAVAELRFGRQAATIPVADCEPGRGAPGRHRLDDAGWRSPMIAAGAAASAPGSSPPCASRHRFVYPLLRGDHARRDRGLRGGVGVLRRRLQGPDPGQHQGDRRRRPIRSTPRINRAFLEYAQARGFHIDPTRVRHPRDKARVERAVPDRPRRLLRRRDPARPRAGARARARSWCSHEYGMRRHTRTQRRPREHFEAEERAALLPAPTARPTTSRCGATRRSPATSYAQVAKALYSLPHPLRRPPPARPRRLGTPCASTTAAMLVKTHPRQPPGGRVHRSGRLPGRARAPTPCATSPSSSARPPRHGEAIGRFAAGPARRARCPGPACAASTRCSASPRATARRASRRPAPPRSPPTCSTSGACSACSNSPRPPPRAAVAGARHPARPLPAPRQPVRPAASLADGHPRKETPQ